MGKKTIPSSSPKDWWQKPLAMFLRLSAWVTVPVVAATFIGDWIDEKNGTAPWGLISVVGVAFVISMVGLVNEAAKEYKKINNFDKKEGEKKNVISRDS